MQPFISIIIPVFNVENYITECLNSVINQTDNDIEIIIVDDGSTDNSGEIAEKYAELDRRIIIIHKPNGGVSSARNAGIKVAHAQYVLFLDSDDYLEINAVEILRSAFKEYDYDTVMFAWNNIDISNLRLKRESVFQSKFIFNENQKNLIYEKFCTGSVLNSVWQRVYKTELINNNNLFFDETQRYCEDLLFSFDYFIYCQNGIYIDEAIYNYRFNPQGLTKTINPNKFNFIKRANQILYSRFRTVGLIEKYDYMLAVRFINVCLCILFENFRNRDKQNIKKLEENMLLIVKDDYFQQCANQVQYRDFNLILKIELFMAKNKMIRSLYLSNRILFSKLAFMIKRFFMKKI